MPLNKIVPESPIVSTGVTLSLNTAMLPVLVLLLTFSASPVVALLVKLVKPLLTVNVLPALKLVLPLSVTVPVPLANVPVLAEKSTFPAPAAKLKFLPAATIVFWFKFIWVAFVVPMLSAPADAVSSKEV